MMLAYLIAIIELLVTPPSTSSPKGAPPLLPAPRAVVPTCTHPPNAPEVIRPTTLEVAITVGATAISVRRTLQFSPTESWKRLCIHSFVLGFPVDPVLGMAKKPSLTFFAPPAERKSKEPVVFQARVPQDVLVAGFVGTPLLFPPLPGSPRDHLFILTLREEGLPIPPAEGGDTRELTVPLKYLNVYGDLKGLSVSVFVQFSDAWFYHGASMPEAHALAGRVEWKLQGPPKQDLQIYFSSQPPPEAEDGTAVQIPPQEDGGSGQGRLWTWVGILLILIGLGGWLAWRWTRRDES